jgi:hypothetical protein
MALKGMLAARGWGGFQDFQEFFKRVLKSKKSLKS